MASWWDSIRAMRRISRGTGIAALVFALLGITTWPVARSIAIAALVLATAAICCALFAWFRLDHLRDLAARGESRALR
jgi:hypothetical protein